MTLEETIQLGEPVEHRGVVIAPLFPRRQPQAEYVTLEEALPLGFRITEIDEAGSVPELLVVNPLEANVLLYDGEELVGAKQNRILNVTVLVAARSETRIPVSCVEEGRWASRSAAFAPARHTAYPELRRHKAQLLSAEPLARGLAQSEVWSEVRSKIDRLEAASPTRAQADVFKSRDDELAKLRQAFPLALGQSGAVFALGEAMCLDCVSRPEAFALLYPKLLDGYLLDAIERLDASPATQGQIEELLAGTGAANRSRRPSASLGEDVRFRGSGVVGSGLELERELIQVCAFTSSPESRRTHVVSPSRRR
jgi:ARG/rhodanese/phosphatase superfamily protein